MPSVFVVLVLAAAGGSGILMSDRKKIILTSLDRPKLFQLSYLLHY